MFGCWRRAADERLAAEAGHEVLVLGQVLGQQLDRHGALEHRVGGQEDGRHAAGAEAALDPVAPGHFCGRLTGSPRARAPRRRRPGPACRCRPGRSRRCRRRPDSSSPALLGRDSARAARSRRRSSVGRRSSSSSSSSLLVVVLRRPRSAVGLGVGSRAAAPPPGPSARRTARRPARRGGRSSARASSRTSGSTSSGSESITDARRRSCSGRVAGDVGAGGAAELEAVLDRVERRWSSAAWSAGIGSPFSSSEPQPAARPAARARIRVVVARGLTVRCRAGRRAPWGGPPARSRWRPRRSGTPRAATRRSTPLCLAGATRRAGRRRAAGRRRRG